MCENEKRLLTGELPMEDDADVDREQEQGMDYESRMLLHTCQAQQHLLCTYSTLTKLDKPEGDNGLSKNETGEKVIFFTNKTFSTSPT